MQKFAIPYFSVLLFLPLFSKTQPIYLAENFNQGWPTEWTTIDNDGNTPDSTVARFTDAWIIFPDIDSAKIGDSVASSTSWYTPPGQADDYMISPQIMIGSTTGVFWDAKAVDPDFSDGYELRISTTTPDIAGFMAHPPLFVTSSAPAKWTNFAVNLDTAGYHNQAIYLAWRNHSNDQFILSIDNIIVKELASFDARISGIDSLSSYSHIPTHQNPAIHLAGQITNVGSQTVTDAKLVAEVLKNGVSVHADSSLGVNLNFGEWANLTMSPYFPMDTGTYTVSYFVSIDETDSHLSNNTAFSTKPLMINDSVFARDIGPASNGLSIGNGTTGEFGLNFSFSKASLLQSVSVFLVNSNNVMVGKPISVKVYAFSDSPSVEIAITDTIIVTQSGAHWLNLPLSGGPFLLDSGTYTFSVQEGESLVSLGYTRDIFTPEAAWIRSEGISWVASETLGFPVAFMIRPNVFCRLRAGINGVMDNDCPDDTDGAIDIFASGGTPPYLFFWSNGNTEEDAVGLPVGMYSATVADVEGCVVKIPETIISSNDSFPDGNITVMISDQGVRFSANSSYGKSFYWDFGDGQSSTVGNPFHTYLSLGTYHILLTVHNDCGTSTFAKVIYVGDITSNITLAPNPNPGTFILHFEDLKLENVIISIFAQTGQKVYSETLKSVESSYDHAVNPERRLAKGIYILEVRSRKSRIYKKFWVK